MSAIWSDQEGRRRAAWSEGTAVVDGQGRLTLVSGASAGEQVGGAAVVSFEVHYAAGYERVATDGMQALAASTGEVAGGDLLVMPFAAGRSIEATVRTEARESGAVLRLDATLKNAGDGPVRIKDPAYHVRIDLLRPRRVRWVEGMQIEEQTMYPASFSPRSIEWHTARRGYTWNSTKGDYRPTSTNVLFPYLVIEGKEGGAFAGFEWSGLWRFHLKTDPAGEDGRGGATLTWTIPLDVTLVPGQAIDIPPVFAGVYRGDVWEASVATHRYVRERVKRKRADDDFPWVQFNTWYSRGNEFNQEQLETDLEIVSKLGFEVFMIDDGWFPCTAGRFGWGGGVGEWVEDKPKFPGGLARFGDLVRSKGMKLGLWIEPERVDMRVLDRLPNLKHHWLAYRDKQLIEHPRGSGQVWSAQLCYGCPEVVEWAKETFSFVIEEYRPDWIKWDHNLYGVCNRWDHGHGTGDGNYRHIQGVYEVFRHLVERFPHVTIENCSAGGTRLDFGMLRYTDTNWVSDLCAPSHRSRSHFSGLVAALPPECINSFVSPHDDEPFTEESARYLLRSRMLGSLGLSLPVEDWSEELRRIVAEEVALYKRLRPFVRHGVVDPLLPPERVPESWAAYQYWNGNAGAVLVFRNESHAPRLSVALKRLDPGARYRLTDADSKEERIEPGEALAGGEFTVVLPQPRSSKVIWIERAG